MQKMMSDKWWVVLLRGLLILAFGLIAIINVQATALALFLWFIALAIVDGLFNIFMSIAHRHDADTWWLGLVSGIISLAIGLAAVVWPGLTALILLYLIAGRALLDGIFAVITAIQLRKTVQGEWLLLVGGSLEILFAIYMFIHPLIGGLTILWVIGAYALVVGTVMIVSAFWLKGQGGGSAGGRLASA